MTDPAGPMIRIRMVHPLPSDRAIGGRTPRRRKVMFAGEDGRGERPRPVHPEGITGRL